MWSVSGSVPTRPIEILLPYDSKLNIVPQADCHAISLLDSNLLIPSRQSIALLVELSIRQALSLVSHDNPVLKVSLALRS